MNIHEHQAKQILKKYGAAVPNGIFGFSADEIVSWSINGGDDASQFSIDSSTGSLNFSSIPDYEVPRDIDNDNSYLVIVRATDSSGNISDQNLTITLEDVDTKVAFDITGGKTVGSKLTISQLGETPIEINSINWNRSANGIIWENISGEATSDYLLTDSDQYYLKATLNFTDAIGESKTVDSSNFRIKSTLYGLGKAYPYDGTDEWEKAWVFGTVDKANNTITKISSNCRISIPFGLRICLPPPSLTSQTRFGWSRGQSMASND